MYHPLACNLLVLWQYLKIHGVLQVDVWDHARSEPVSTFQWGAESALSVRFNPVSACPHGHAACKRLGQVLALSHPC